MRKTVLFIAVSLDGYIADRAGGVGWLQDQEECEETGESYFRLLREIDTVVMGGRTYRQVTEELSPDVWPYQELISYVVTERACTSCEPICFVNEPPAHLIRRLREQEGKDIWICGGASLVQQLMEEDLIDRFHLSLIPTLLGGGIRLFDSIRKELPLRLTEMRQENGIAELIYERR